MRRNLALVLATIAAIAGLVFSAVSTRDFVQHLDRQVHGLHCSFLPGMDAPDVSGETGCHVTLMSPYSSVFRDRVWGGVPISLPAMATFAFLAAFGVALILMRRQGDRRLTLFYALAWLLPVGASVVMGYISLATLGAACKLCIGIYAASGVGFVASLVQAILARQSARTAHPIPAEESTGGTAPIPLAARAVSWGVIGIAFAIGVLFVLVPVGTYALVSPDFSRFVGTCGTLPSPADPQRVLIAIGPQTREVPVLEVLDPLCPACKAFEERLQASGLEPKLHRVGLLFPLDETCNWMVSKSLHPGACAVSEAILCAHRQGMPVDQVLSWAFEHQAELLAAEKAKPGAAAEHVTQKFGALASCLGSAEVQADLNKSLRWAVAHELPVMTPQLYVGGVKVCDEDTDLGLEWALSQVLDKQAAGALPVVRPTTTAPPPGSGTDDEPPSTGRNRAAGDTAPRAKTPAQPEPASKPIARAEPKAEPVPQPEPDEPEPQPEPEPKAEPKAEPGPGGEAPAPSGKLPSIGEIPPPKPDEPSEENEQ